MNESLAVIDPGQLAVVRAPEVVLEEAQKAAAALKRVLDNKPNKVMMGGAQYLEFEDWQTLGRFYGITAKVVSTEYVEYGEVRGFTAKAVAVRSDGMEISGAEADCLDDEPKWRSRATYEWKTIDGKREKVKTGEEPVPTFQLKSMAQTRAQAKALRSVLAWVVVLAGYKPTPAEELPQAESVPSGTVKDGEVVGDAHDGKLRVAGIQPFEKFTKVTLSDGRSGTAWNDKGAALITKARECLENGWEVTATFTESPNAKNPSKPYVNLTTLDRVVAVQAPVADEDKEPVGEPESIMSIRETKTKPPYWVVQSSARQYATNQQAHHDWLQARKAAGQKAIIGFVKHQTTGGVKNVIMQLADVPTDTPL